MSFLCGLVSRRARTGALPLVLTAALGCGSETTETDSPGAGGTVVYGGGSGGTTAGAGTGGEIGEGGTQASGGAVNAGSGGVATGGTAGSAGSGGVATGGTAGSAGVATGGTAGSAGSGGTADDCNATTTPVARHGRLRVEGGRLLNQCGRPVQFASMSMYDWSQEGRQFYNATAVRNLAGTGTGQMKCTTVRIPLLARNWPAEYPRIRRVMDACLDNGIYCIPNWHVVGGSDVNRAKEFYLQLATDYGHTPNILYEPWNEPTTQTWSQIKSYMEEIMDAVRPIDPEGIFLAGTRQWCQRPDEACDNPINRPNVGYVFHFYANTHPLSSFRAYIDQCLSARQLVWTTEYGGVDANGDGNFNVTEVNRWWDYMDEHLISSNNWALETNPETSSVFTADASSTGPWPDSELTNSGRHVFAYIAGRYPVTMSQ